MGNSVKRNSQPTQERIIPIQLEYDEVDRDEKGMPSVFRHLRPEFRHQLPVKSPVRSPESTTKDIPIAVEQEIVSNIYNGGVGSSNGSTSGINGEYKVKQNGCGSSLLNKVAPSAEEEASSSPAVVPPVVENLVPKPLLPEGAPCKPSGTSSSSSSVKDGHYFLKVVEEEVAKIESSVAELESEFEKHSATMTEEVRGKVLACTGKAKLLISQKIKQFSGLCHKNISGEMTDDFPTTCEDLQGFWDMVSLQVDDIHKMLAALKAIKANNWVEVAVAAPVPKASAGRSARKVRPVQSAADKEKDLARKKAIEERRKAMRQAMKAKKAAAADSEVEIFVPEEKQWMK